MTQKLNLTRDEKEYIDRKVERFGSSSTVAYLLWLFFGGFGVHRFYLGAIKSGITMVVINVLGFVLILFGTFGTIFSSTSFTDLQNYTECVERQPNNNTSACDHFLTTTAQETWNEKPPIGAMVTMFIGMGLLVIIALWWVVDAFLIPGIIRKKNKKVRQRYIEEVLKQRQRQNEIDDAYGEYDDYQ